MTNPAILPATTAPSMLLSKDNFKLETGNDVFGNVDDVHYRYHIFALDEPVIFFFSHRSNLYYPTRNEALSGEKFPPSFQYFKKRGINVFSFICIEKHNWYMSEEFLAFTRQLGKIFSIVPRKISIGSSMGAFGAALHGDNLKVDHAILYSPVSTLNSDVAGLDKRYEERFFKQWEDKKYDIALSKCEKTVVFDPTFKLDAFHANRLTNAKLLALPGGGHGTSHLLSRIKELEWFQDSILYNSFSSLEFYRKTRKRRFVDQYYDRLLNDFKTNDHLTEKRGLIIESYKKAMSAMWEHQAYGSFSDIISSALGAQRIAIITHNGKQLYFDQIRFNFLENDLYAYITQVPVLVEQGSGKLFCEGIGYISFSPEGGIVVGDEDACIAKKVFGENRHYIEEPSSKTYFCMSKSGKFSVRDNVRWWERFTLIPY